MFTKKIIMFVATMAFLFLATGVYPVFAQTPEAQVYRLDIDKDFGSGLGSDIQGTFTLSIVGPGDFDSVSYFIDGELMMEVVEAPFDFQFNTEQYSYGPHALTAMIRNNAGDTFTTIARNMNFMSPEDEATVFNQKILPFLLILVGVFVVGRMLIFGSKRKQPSPVKEFGVQRDYSAAGGSVCKHCGRPTPRHVWGLNILVGKLDRCENCGKWSVMQVATYDVLRQAEVSEKKETLKNMNDAEKLKELIDKSKYE